MSKRRAFSIAEKVSIIERLESGAAIADICREMTISQSTVSTIWKSRAQINQKFLNDVTKSKKIKTSQHQDIEKALLEWFKIQRNRNIPISGPILQEKANDFGKQLNKQDFVCSHSWITRFRKRHNIIFGKICGEAASTSKSVCENWLQNVWPTLCQNYDDKDIYNADETGLFFRLTPDKTLRFKGEPCHGDKLSKERLTVLVTSNMTGSDKRRLVVIGKSKTPRCFKNIKSLPVDYKNNNKAWMTSDIFKEWLKIWDQELKKQNRKILLLIDNCPSHPAIQNLRNIELVFLPPNMTSVLQPMDQGIIRTLKAKFRKRLVLKILNRMEQNIDEKISVLDAILMLADAWKDVPEISIVNCFRHAGFGTTTNQEGEINEMPEKIDDLDLMGIISSLPYTHEQIADFASVDENVVTYEVPSEKEIIESITKAEEKEELEEAADVEEMQFKVPTLSEVYQSLDHVRTFVSTNEELNSTEIATALRKVENYIQKAYFAEKSKQTIITDYFKSNE